VNSDLVALELLDIIDILHDDTYSADTAVDKATTQLYALIKQLVIKDVVPHYATIRR